MAKIGTAHVEIKPVLNEDALAEITDRIEAAVKAGVEAGIKAARPAPTYVVNIASTASRTAEDDAVLANVIRERTARYGQGGKPQV